MTQPNKTSRRLRRALLLGGVVVVLLLAFTGYQALKAKTALEQVAADFETLTGQLPGGDQAGAESTLASAQRHAGDAFDNTRGPVWWLSSKLPEVGPNVDAVRVVAEVADRLASDVLPDVVTAAGTLTPGNLRPVRGRVDLEPIQQIEPAVVRAATALSAESREVDDIDTSRLVSQIAAPVSQLQTRIADADELADRASRAVRLLPPMLGADGERSYLFMFQNNAEIRATGGIPGAFAIITANDGKVTLGRQGDAGTVGRFEKPPTPLTDQERALFGEDLGRFPQDVNFTPDFPRTAELIAGMWEARKGQQVDGVVSTDPVALSYILNGTGPVETAGGRTLTAEGAVPLLLSQVYAEIPDPEKQNDFFNAAAGSVFDAVAAGTGEPRIVLDSLSQAASERRVLIWSARRGEQRLLAPTALAGGLETRATTAPEVGVYFNAALPYKLDYYLDYEVSVESTRCQGSRQRLTVKVRMQSRAPRDLASFTDYVAPDVPAYPRGSIVDTLYFFAPVDGSHVALSVDGQDRGYDVQRLDGRDVFATSVVVEPGKTRSLTVHLVSGPGQVDEPTLRVTPGVRSDGIGTVGASSCPELG